MFSNILYILTPNVWGNDPILRSHIFEMGGEQPPPRRRITLLKTNEYLLKIDASF